MYRYLVVFILAAGLTAFLQRTFFSNEKVEISWYDFNSALQIVSSEKNSGNKQKKILLFVYADWCSWCKKMEKEFYGRSDVAKYLNENYYPVKLNADSPNDIIFNGKTYKYIRQKEGNYHQFVAALMNNRLSFPTNVIMDNNLEILKSIHGFVPPEELFCMTKFIGSDIYKSKTWEDFEKNCN
jgi:thioredoxin-related protein